MLTEDPGAPSADCIILVAYWTVVEVCDDKTVYCLRNILESFLLTLNVLANFRSLLHLFIVPSC